MKAGITLLLAFVSLTPFSFALGGTVTSYGYFVQSRGGGVSYEGIAEYSRGHLTNVSYGREVFNSQQLRTARACSRVGASAGVLRVVIVEEPGQRSGAAGQDVPFIVSSSRVISVECEQNLIEFSDRTLSPAEFAQGWQSKRMPAPTKSW